MLRGVTSKSVKKVGNVRSWVALPGVFSCFRQTPTLLSTYYGWLMFGEDHVWFRCVLKIFEGCVTTLQGPKVSWLLYLRRLVSKIDNDMLRVATAQGKQGIWKSIFPDRENTGNLLKNIKNMFLHREFTTNTGKIWVSKKKKKKRTNLSGWNYPLAVLCQDLGLHVILAAVL